MKGNLFSKTLGLSLAIALVLTPVVNLAVVRDNVGGMDTSVSTEQAGEGAASAEDIRKGHGAYVDGQLVVGTMPDSTIDKTLTNGSVTLTAGESVNVTKGFLADNLVIKTKDLASQTQGTATENTILNGKTAWVNGTKVTGTLTLDNIISAINDKGGSVTQNSTPDEIAEAITNLKIVTETTFKTTYLKTTNIGRIVGFDVGNGETETFSGQNTIFTNTTGETKWYQLQIYNAKYGSDTMGSSELYYTSKQSNVNKAAFKLDDGETLYFKYSYTGVHRSDLYSTAGKTYTVDVYRYGE